MTAEKPEGDVALLQRLRRIPIDFGDGTHEDHVCWQAATRIEDLKVALRNLLQYLYGPDWHCVPVAGVADAARRALSAGQGEVK